MARSDTNRIRWEYLRLQVESHKIKTSDDSLRELGLQGWELTSVVEAGGSYIHMWFKRPLD